MHRRSVAGRLLYSFLICLQVCVSWIWAETGSEGHYGVTLHPAARHPGRPYRQPWQRVLLQRSRGHQELQPCWSSGHQLLSRWSVCNFFLSRIIREWRHCSFFPLLFYHSAQHFSILELSFLLCRVNRKADLHLSAPLPLWQSHPARERAGPESQRGAPHDLPWCWASKRLCLCDLWLPGAAALMLFYFVYFVFSPTDNWVHLEFCQENSSKHDVRAVKRNQVSCPP